LGNLGGRIYTGSHVNEVHGGKEAYVKTDDDFKISAAHLVVATNTPINDWVKMHTKQAAYRTYVVAFEVPKNSYPGFLLWDMEDPYHYVRIVRGEMEDLLLVGGEDHKTGQADDMAERYRRLEGWAKHYFSQLGPVKFRWSGQIIEPVDGLAFIGRNPGDQNVYIATGDSGNGMTHGTIAGMLISDLIQGRNNPWQEVYEPSRKSLKSIGTYVKENANVVVSMLKERVAPSEIKFIAALPPGCGAIMREGTSKIAVYRDEQGKVRSDSAICPHLGCIVQWNAGEKSWDCPCHGARFDTEGKILNGPAVKRLKPIEVKDR
jgi:Rieske Fe-S protein